MSACVFADQPRSPQMALTCWHCSHCGCTATRHEPSNTKVGNRDHILTCHAPRVRSGHASDIPIHTMTLTVMCVMCRCYTFCMVWSGDKSVRSTTSRCFFFGDVTLFQPSSGFVDEALTCDVCGFDSPSGSRFPSAMDVCLFFCSNRNRRFLGQLIIIL